MKNEQTSGRAATLMNEALDLLMRADQLPPSPVGVFLEGDARRAFRRSAERLRAGKVRPRYKDRYTSEQLADIYDRAVQHDEMVEQARIDFERKSLELGRALAENDPEERKKLDLALDEIARAAEENGPGSEAARRYEHLQILGWIGKLHNSQKRRQKARAPRQRPEIMNPFPAVEPVGPETFPPPLASGELVVAMRPKGRESERARVYVRIQTRNGGATSIGTAERGYESLFKIFELPDGNQLFVSTEANGYIIDVKTRTLVEEIGGAIFTVRYGQDLTLFFIYREDGRVEALGKSGRLWTTQPIGMGEFRNDSLKDGVLGGEARSGDGWMGFSVDVATGEVRFAEGAAIAAIGDTPRRAG